VPERDQRGRETFRLTPFLLGALVLALITTGLVMLAWYSNAGRAPAPGGGAAPPPPPPPPPPQHGYLIVAVGLACIAWISVIIAFTRDQIMRHFDNVAAQLVERAEQEGIFRGMNIAEDERAAPPPPDPDQRVIPFHR
jgi:hypothetical protein